DVESAKIAARGLLDARPEPSPALFTSEGIEVRTAGGLEIVDQSIEGAGDALLAVLPSNGYVSVPAYLDRPAFPELTSIREALARRAGRPVTFGWGPRFLHSTGQFHKGGPAVGVFLQIVGAAQEDLEIPGRPFTFGQLIQAQATGDASVLAEHERPVLT